MRIDSICLCSLQSIFRCCVINWIVNEQIIAINFSRKKVYKLCVKVKSDQIDILNSKID